MKQRRKILSLVITRNCNLNCSYCYVVDKRAVSMSFNTACRAIRDAFSEAEKKFDFLEISFIGGEPLCEFSLLKRLAGWVRRQKFTLPHVLYATTNGTLMDDEKKAWFTKHKDEFVLGLSYDGQFVSQDKNRSASSSLVDLDFFLRTWPSQSLKMTIDESSVAYLSQNIITLHERGALVSANCACGMPDWEKASWNEYARQLKKLVKFYLTHPQYKPINLIDDFDLIKLAFPKRKHKRHCEAGTSAYNAVDIDGSCYACHMFSPLAIPQSQNVPKISTLLRRSRRECDECYIEPQCMTCYGMSYKLSGDVLHRENNICMATKIQFAACCKFHAERLKMKSSSDYSTDDVAIAKALLKLHAWGIPHVNYPRKTKEYSHVKVKTD